MCSDCDHVKRGFAVSIEYPNLYSFVCLFLGEALPTTSHPRRKGLGKSEHNSSSIARCNHSETSFIYMKLLSLLLPAPLCHQRIKILPIFSNCIEKNPMLQEYSYTSDFKIVFQTVHVRRTTNQKLTRNIL